MTVDDFLSKSTRRLVQAGIDTARLDSLILLEDVSGYDRAYLLAHPLIKISVSKQAKLTQLLDKRAEHIPLAYIRGFAEFYGKKFVLNQNVLQPRPESESIIDLLLKLEDLPDNTQLADVGTGSGALGIIAKMYHPSWAVELLDIDEKALQIAKMNVDKNTIEVSAITSNLLENSKQNNDILLCNLPYVPDNHKLTLSATKEPRIAIFGGPDGLDLYRLLFKQIDGLHYKPLYLICESLPLQHTKLTKLAHKSGYSLRGTMGFAQVFRYHN